MSRKGIRGKATWDDRYRTPTADQLRSALEQAHLELFDTVRGELLAFESISEELRWLGIPWRWSFAYRFETGGVLAYLIPQPAKPQLALPLAREIVASLPQRKLSRFVRDALTFAPEVNGIRWASWELTSKSQADELLGVVRRKHEAIFSPAAQA